MNAHFVPYAKRTQQNKNFVAFKLNICYNTNRLEQNPDFTMSSYGFLVQQGVLRK